MFPFGLKGLMPLYLSSHVESQAPGRDPVDAVRLLAETELYFPESGISKDIHTKYISKKQSEASKSGSVLHEAMKIRKRTTVGFLKTLQLAPLLPFLLPQTRSKCTDASCLCPDWRLVRRSYVECGTLGFRTIRMTSDNFKGESNTAFEMQHCHVEKDRGRRAGLQILVGPGNLWGPLTVRESQGWASLSPPRFHQWMK